MKTTIAFFALVLFQGAAFGVGGESGGATGGGDGSSTSNGTRLMRGPASPEMTDAQILGHIDNYGKVCLEDLGSTAKIDVNDKDYKSKMIDEIELAAKAKKKEIGEDAVNSREYPDCYAYGREVGSSKIMFLFVKKKNEPLPSPLPEPGKRELGTAIPK